MPPRKERDRFVEVVAPRARQSYRRAIHGGATLAERAVLAAVHHFLVTWSRVDDRLSLGQVAVAAGLYEGPARDCPKRTQQHVANRLRRLQELGAISYEPSRGGRQASLIGLPPVDSQPHPHEVGQPHPSEVGLEDVQPHPHEVGQDDNEGGQPHPRKVGQASKPTARSQPHPPEVPLDAPEASSPTQPSAVAPPNGGSQPHLPEVPTREVPEEGPEGTCPRATAVGPARCDAAALAARLAAVSTPGAWPDEPTAVVNLAIELAGADATCTAVAWLEGRDLAGLDPVHAGILLAGLDIPTDDDGTPKDPRAATLIARAGPPLIADTGAAWPADAHDLAIVAAWLDQLDDDQHQAALDRIHDEQPATVRLACRAVRAAVPDAPRLTLPRKAR